MKSTFNDAFKWHCESNDWHNWDEDDKAREMMEDWFLSLSEKTKFAIASNYVVCPDMDYDDNPWLTMLSDAQCRVMSRFKYDTGGACVYLTFRKIED